MLYNNLPTQYAIAVGVYILFIILCQFRLSTILYRIIRQNEFPSAPVYNQIPKNILIAFFLSFMPITLTLLSYLLTSHFYESSWDNSAPPLLQAFGDLFSQEVGKNILEDSPLVLSAIIFPFFAANIVRHISPLQASEKMGSIFNQGLSIFTIWTIEVLHEMFRIAWICLSLSAGIVLFWSRLHQIHFQWFHFEIVTLVFFFGWQFMSFSDTEHHISSLSVKLRPAWLVDSAKDSADHS